MNILKIIIKSLSLLYLIFYAIFLLLFQVTVFAGKEILTIEIVYFYVDVCPVCQSNIQFIDKIVKDIENKYNRNVCIKIYKYNISSKYGYLMFKNYQYTYNVNNVREPAVFVGDTYISTDAEIRKRLGTVIEDYIVGKKKYKKIDIVNFSNSEIIAEEKKKLNNFTFTTIALAGLIDGFNPCAVSMLLFFLSLLIMSGKSKKVVFITGINYILGVFIMYFLIGIGLFKVGDMVKDARTIMIVIYLITIIISIVFAILNLKDFLNIQKGNFSKITLQLPRTVRHFIQNYLRKIVKYQFYWYLIAYISGGVVASLEFFCTGQIYLPTITYLLSQSVIVAKATILLFIYNVAFIIPLFGILILVLVGKKVTDLSEHFLARLKIIKLATAGFFVTISILIFVELWKII